MDGRRARRPTRWPTACSDLAAVQLSLRRRSCGGSRAPRWRRPSRCSSSSGLRDQDPVVMPALRWLEEHLAAQGTTADEIVRARAPAAGSDERDRAQRDHQHAPDLRLRLGGILRERQSCRRNTLDRHRLCRSGLRDTRSLPARDRRTVAGLTAR